MATALRVLIIEDSAADAELLLRELRRGGYQPVSQLIDTPEAMNTALDGQSWDIVLSDYVMPRFNGMAALDMLKRRGFDLPFIIVSGKIGEETAVEAMRAGAHDYVVKGNVARLIPAIQREMREAVVRRERRQAEEALRKAHAELERRVEERTAELARTNKELQAEVVERKKAQEEREDVLRTVSHDLRNPLTTIQGHAQLLRQRWQRAGLDGPDLRSAEAIEVCARRMNAMIQDLTDSARLKSDKQRLDKQPVCVMSFVSDLLERVATVMDVGRITLDIPADLPTVHADPVPLERIIMNLLTNALKYSTPKAPILVKARLDGREVSISVVDEGMGISPEDQTRIFDRFFRSRNVGETEGIGLGLYITKKLVEAHGGRIWVESEPCRYAAFHFTLPTTSGL